MQAKQKSLLKRVDALDEEREELQRQLEEKEEVQTNLDNQLKTIIDLKEQQQAELSQQQVDKSLSISVIQRLMLNAYIVAFFP